MTANPIGQSITAASAKAADPALWRRWVAATLVGGWLGSLLSFYVYWNGTSFYPVFSVVPFIGSTLLGLVLGVFQGRALRNSLGAQVWPHWALMTWLGLILSIGVAGIVGPQTDRIITSLSGISTEAAQFGGVILFSTFQGLIVGGLQCIILWSHTRKAAWWPLGLAAGLVVGNCIALEVSILAIASIIGPNPTMFAVPYMFFISGVSSACIPWPFTAVITGSVLVKLLTNPEKPSTSISSNYIMTKFERLYSELERRYGPASPELRPLMAEFFDALMAEPVDLPVLKQSMVQLLHFLTTPEGRTDANCYLVNMAIVFPEWGDIRLPELPDDFGYIIADMGGALHDTVSSPEMAYNFESTPEQLLERTQKLLQDV